MQQLIEAIVKPLVDYPEDVRIETDETSNRIVYKLLHKATSELIIELFAVFSVMEFLHDTLF